MSDLPTREELPRIQRGGSPVRRAGAPATSAGPTLTGRDILRILQKRKWMVIVTATVVIGVVLVGTFLWWQYAPFYTVQAFLEVKPPAGSPFQTTAQGFSGDAERIKQTHVRMIMTEAVLAQAALNPTVNATKWFQKDPGDIIRRLRESIDVVPDRTADLIMLEMTSPAPTEEDQKEIAIVVTAVAEAYVEDTRKTASSNRQGEIARLTSERDENRTKLDASRRLSEAARAGVDIPDMYEQRTVLSLKLQTLTRELMELEMAEAQTTGAVKAVKDQRASGALAQALEVVNGVEQDRDLAMLRNALANKTAMLENALGKYGPSHRVVQTLQADIAGLKTSIAERQKLVANVVMDALVQQREAMASATTVRRLQVQEKFNEASTQAKELSATLTRLEQLSQEQRDLTDMIRRIDNTLAELRMLTTGEAPVVLRRPATPPREISMPKWTVMVPLAVLAGIVFGLGLAFLVEFLDTSVKGPADISRRVDLPMLGMIPHLDDLDEEIDEIALAFKTHPDSLVGEAFRQIRTCLFFSGPAEQRRCLLVTSPLPEDGRTTVAVNLAGTIAQSGLKVLVVDANFRQPKIGSLFPETRGDGLSSALVGRSPWQTMVKEVEPNLSVLAAGPLPPNPAELLGSEQMRGILAEMVEQYDQVLIDGPPCMVVTDPCVLASRVDGVLLVVRAGANTYGIVQRARDMFVRVGAHLMGITLNGVRATSGGYLRKNYETFYEYRTPQQRRLAAEPNE